jgi:hypothetical protein
MFDRAIKTISQVATIAAAFKKAIDATVGVADTFVAKPVTAGGRGVGRGFQWSFKRVFRRRR